MQFRKSKKIGPFRLSASKSGLSVSGGVPGARVSANTKGEVRRTLGVPGTGLYDTKVVSSPSGNGGGRSPNGEGAANFDVIEAARHTRELSPGSPDVTTEKIVSVSQSDLTSLAAWTGLPVVAGMCRGIRDAVLVSSGAEFSLLVMTTMDDNPKAFGRRARKLGHPVGRQIGRLNKRAADRLLAQIGPRNVKCVVYIEATPGLKGFIEARWFTDALIEG